MPHPFSQDSSFRLAAIAAVFCALPVAQASGLGHVRFVVVDPLSGKPTNGFVSLSDAKGRHALLATSLFRSGETAALDSGSWSVEALSTVPGATTIRVPLGTTVTLIQQDPVPTKEIVIRVTATRLAPNKAPVSAAATTRDRSEIQKFNNTAQADAKQLTKGQAGIAEDSAGQAHVRGEHGDISYVVDGVPLPDTLAGRQGTVVVSNTIQTLEIITGGFAPEYGGQVAAVLNVATRPSVLKPETDYTLQSGSFGAINGDLTSAGPLGKRANYVIDLNASHTENYQEPSQPDDQTAHNAGNTQSAFARLRLNPNSRDAFSFTVSGNPAAIEVGNRTGLPGRFKAAGQGYGLFGLRNADGTRPDVTADNAGTLGSETLVLPSQQAAGQDINEKDVTNFATLSYLRKVNAKDQFQFAMTLMHSGQDVTNDNPAVDLNNLPVDSSIEFNPTANRNIHHLQFSGNYQARRGAHQLKAGFVYDGQSGSEIYRIEPASQLALNALAALAPSLAPAGTASTDLDVNGNPIFTPTGPSPTLNIRRTGSYRAAYAQDTWRIGRTQTNYGVRADWYDQKQNLGTDPVSEFQLSPRVNFQYELDHLTRVNLAYNRLLNTPPLAQGASLGAVIPPETFDQYDASVTRKVASNQSVTLAYYYKQIENQIDLGLLIPGSQIGLYSAVSLDRAGVHGIELSYEIGSTKGSGLDGYLNYSYNAAKPAGFDNLGEAVEPYNDHDQRQTLGAGVAYTWRSGATIAATYQLGSGLASSIVPPDTSRTPRDQIDLKLTTGDRLFHGRGGITLDVQNLLDHREVINFQSAFSGTRFQQARRIFLSINGKL